MKHMKNRNHLIRPVFTSLFAALICVCTWVIKIPIPIGGYIHLGDAVVLLSGFLLGPFWGFLAAAIGSMFADIFGSYVIYAPATFLIKGLVAMIGFYMAVFFKHLCKRSFAAYWIGAFAGEIWMVCGYYLFEATVCGYGFAVALSSVPFQLIQAVAGAMLSVVLLFLLKRVPMVSHLLDQQISHIRKG